VIFVIGRYTENLPNSSKLCRTITNVLIHSCLRWRGTRHSIFTRSCNTCWIKSSNVDEQGLDCPLCQLGHLSVSSTPLRAIWICICPKYLGRIGKERNWWGMGNACMMIVWMLCWDVLLTPHPLQVARLQLGHSTFIHMIYYTVIGILHQ